MKELPLIQPSMERWDIFCAVVDNFGDIGVCWRLARQLVAEQTKPVRLWVDDLHSFRRICPDVDPQLAQQVRRGVEICRWDATNSVTLAATPVAEVVVEAFGCGLPPAYLEDMARRATAPVWINLEYLSAEGWVVGCHGLPSPQPRLPLTRHFFFPGFCSGTGGLLRESSLLRERRAFQRDPDAQAAFWRSLGLTAAAPDELRISLFAYGNRELSGLLEAWRASPQPILCLVPEGAVATAIGRLFGAARAVPGDRFAGGSLTVQVLPFLEQDRYDRLLWACDVNFVRGEDSFVRAQWAGRPLVWQIYRQQEDAHLAKLEAFLRLYGQGLEADAVDALESFWRAWNGEDGVAGTWPAFLAQRERLGAQTEHWITSLTALGDLASNLVLFSKKYL